MEYTEQQAREALVRALHQAWADSPYSGVALYGENTTAPNMDQVDEVLEYRVVFEGDEQTTLAENPIVRTRGMLELTVAVREGAGTSRALGIRSFLKKAFKARWIEKVRTTIPTPRGNASAKGWYLVSLAVPFRFDSRDNYTPPTP